MRCRGCNKKLGSPSQDNPLTAVTCCPNKDPEQWHLKCLVTHHAGEYLADAVIENWGSGRGTVNEPGIDLWTPRAVTVGKFDDEEL